MKSKKTDHSSAVKRGAKPSLEKATINSTPQGEPSWDVRNYHDDRYFRNQHGEKIENPQKFMDTLLGKTTTNFAAGIKHVLVFMVATNRFYPWADKSTSDTSSFVRDLLGGTDTPSAMEESIIALTDIHAGQLRPLKYHQELGLAMAACLAAERMRQQLCFKLGRRSSRTFFRETSETIQALEKALADLDSAMLAFYEQFYKRFLASTLSPSEKFRERMTHVYREVERQQALKKLAAHESGRRIDSKLQNPKFPKMPN